MVEDRGASSVVGVILVVGVAVILAATVSVLALGLVEEEEPQPGAAFEWSEYDPNHGVLTWTHVSGENLEAERFIEKGGAVDGLFTDFTITAGEGTPVHARPGDTVRLVENEGETRHVLSTHEVPDNRPLQPLNWSAAGSNPLERFQSNFYEWGVTDGLVWGTRSDHVRATTNQSGGALMLYSRTIPENSGNVTVEMRFEQESFQSSGYTFYVEDQSADELEVWCEAGGVVSCSGGTPTINGTETRSITMDEEIGAIYLALDLANPQNRDEIAKFYNLTVKAN